MVKPVVVEKPGSGKLVLVACDVLMMNRDLLDPVVEEVATALGTPASHILINCTHTHHAPSTCTVHGYKRDELFCRRVQQGIVKAAKEANAKLKGGDAAPKDGKEVRKHVMRMHGRGPFGAHMIVMADTDKDGKITQAEAEALALQHFDRMDTNKDGQVTREERRAARPMIIKHIEEKKEGGS